MSIINQIRTCPICRVKVTGTICSVCRTSLMTQASSLGAAAAQPIANVVSTDSRFAQYGIDTEEPGRRVEGTVIKELSTADWRQREPWAVISFLLFLIVAMPAILVVGIFALTIMIILMIFGARLLGMSILGSIFAFPLMIFRGRERQPRQSRQFIVQTATGNRRVIQIGEWNSYLYEGCQVILRGRDRNGLFVIESGEDLDNQRSALIRHDRPWPWSTIAAVLALIAFVEYASLLTETGY